MRLKETDRQTGRKRDHRFRVFVLFCLKLLQNFFVVLNIYFYTLEVHSKKELMVISIKITVNKYKPVNKKIACLFNNLYLTNNHNLIYIIYLFIVNRKYLKYHIYVFTYALIQFNTLFISHFILLDLTKMPSLPQGAFAACKLREQNAKSKQIALLKNPEMTDSSSKLYNANKKLMEYSPVKYNDKFMNAIWGRYNRYSPHNIKSNDAAGSNKGPNFLSAAAGQPQQQ